MDNFLLGNFANVIGNNAMPVPALHTDKQTEELNEELKELLEEVERNNKYKYQKLIHRASSPYEEIPDLVDTKKMVMKSLKDMEEGVNESKNIRSVCDVIDKSYKRLADNPRTSSLVNPNIGNSSLFVSSKSHWFVSKFIIVMSRKDPIKLFKLKPIFNFKALDTEQIIYWKQRQA